MVKTFTSTSASPSTSALGSQHNSLNGLFKLFTQTASHLCNSNSNRTKTPEGEFDKAYDVVAEVFLPPISGTNLKVPCLLLCILLLYHFNNAGPVLLFH